MPPSLTPTCKSSPTTPLPCPPRPINRFNKLKKNRIQKKPPCSIAFLLHGGFFGGRRGRSFFCTQKLWRTLRARHLIRLAVARHLPLKGKAKSRIPYVEDRRGDVLCAPLLTNLSKIKPLCTFLTFFQLFLQKILQSEVPCGIIVCQVCVYDPPNL